MKRSADMTPEQRQAHHEMIKASPIDNHNGKADQRDFPEPPLGVSAFSAGFGFAPAGGPK